MLSDRRRDGRRQRGRLQPGGARVHPSCRLLGSRHTLRFGEPLPLTEMLEGAYLDDHVFCCRMPLERLGCFPGHDADCPRCEHDAGQLTDVDLRERLHAAYDAFEVTQSKSKEVKHAATFTAWGTEVNGRGGFACVSADKRRQIARLVFAAIRRGYVSKTILQSLVGSLVHPFMHARCLMSTLNRTYRCLASMTPCADVRISAAVQDELTAAMLLLAYSYTELRAEVPNILSAADATTIRGGRCDCVIPDELAAALWGRGERRGECGKLRWTDLEQSLLPTKMPKPDQELASIVTSLPWVCGEGLDFDGPVQHINIQELRAVIGEIGRKITNAVFRKRLAIFIDSRVVTGAVAKGRSSSIVLNTWLPRLTIRCLSARLQLRVLRTDAKSNPADAPSRRVPLPPRTPTLDWVKELFENAKQVVETAYSRRCKPRVVPSGAPGMPHKLVQGRRGRVGVVVNVKAASSHHRPTFREYYSGCGRLASEMRKLGVDTCEYELEGPDGIRPEADMCNAANVDAQIADARAGEILGAHFGICCASWSRMQVLFNGGTRSAANPYGNDALKREVLGNTRLREAWRLLEVLSELRIPATLENPDSSTIWDTREMTVLSEHGDASIAKLDQCMLQLRPPEWTATCSDDVRVMKPTRIVGTVDNLESLSCKCDRKHKHCHALGFARVNGRRVSRAKAAGAYPIALARRLAKLLVQHQQ